MADVVLFNLLYNEFYQVPKTKGIDITRLAYVDFMHVQKVLMASPFFRNSYISSGKPQCEVKTDTNTYEIPMLKSSQNKAEIYVDRFLQIGDNHKEKVI